MRKYRSTAVAQGTIHTRHDFIKEMNSKLGENKSIAIYSSTIHGIWL